MNQNMNEQETKLIEQLNLVKEKFIKNIEELEVSIRKDVVAIQLKDILKNNNNFENLKIAIENYINTLLPIPKDKEN